MYRFVIRTPAGRVIERRMDKDVITIGRAPGNDIVLVGPNVSRRHGRIYLWEGMCCIEDVGSSNGVYVNGYRITVPVTINEHSVIDIGGFDVSLVVGENSLPGDQTAKVARPNTPTARDAVPEPPEETAQEATVSSSLRPGMRPNSGTVPRSSMSSAAPAYPGNASQPGTTGTNVTRTSHSSPHTIGAPPTAAATPKALAQTEPDGRPSPVHAPTYGATPGSLAATAGATSNPNVAILRAVSGPLRGQTFALPSVGVFTVGRAQTNDLVVLDDSVSRSHAKVLISDAGVIEVLDLGSSNGTRVDGFRVPRRAMTHGTRVRFGNIEFVLEISSNLTNPVVSRNNTTDFARWVVIFIGLLLAVIVALIFLLRATTGTKAPAQGAATGAPQPTAPIIAPPTVPPGSATPAAPPADPAAAPVGSPNP
jgi:pSer/pThr/pTyr-binding forkhead associated (FHA) protein